MRTCYLLLLALGSVIFLSGCSDLGFYWQAASGHLDLLNRKQNIRELLDSPETSLKLKRKLKLVESVRTFAVSQMALPENEGYTGYVDMGRSYVTMVVTAAPELELKHTNGVTGLLAVRNIEAILMKMMPGYMRKKWSKNNWIFRWGR